MALYFISEPTNLIKVSIRVYHNGSISVSDIMGFVKGQIILALSSVRAMKGRANAER